LTACIVEDLRATYPLLGQHFDSGELELRQNVGLSGRRHMSPLAPRTEDDDQDAEIDPNIDGVVLSAGREGRRALAPIALENKTIMTAHGKARTNRYNDARAYASHVHNSSPTTIAAFTIVINTALTYRNPDAFARSARSSGTNPAAAARATVGLFTSMRLRNELSEPVGRCEAVLVLAIEYDGETPTARLVEDDTLLAADSPFNYQGFQARIGRLYLDRFGQ
jgi:hypothetical protein